MAKMVKAVLNGEFEIILPEHRADRPDWYTEHGWERARLHALWSEIRLQVRLGIQPVVYYVGAEEGEMPALCQMWGAKVVMFEPNPKVWANIKAIWDANKLEAPLAGFVGFASASTELEPPNPDPAAEGVYLSSKPMQWPRCADGPVIGDHGFKELYQESDAFPQIKIDDMVKKTGIVPTIISFDVEGSEWQVMKGAESTVAMHMPVIFASISPEFMFHQFQQYSRDFRNWLIDFGYDETLLAYDHELHTLYKPVKP